MPINPHHLIALKQDVVEMTVVVTDPGEDNPTTFIEAIHELTLDHQYQAMIDPTILDPYNLKVGTVVESRDPLPTALKDGLITLGFGPLESESGGQEARSLFSRFQKKSRSKLDRWRLTYVRAEDVSARFGEFEESLIEEVPNGELQDVVQDASNALIRATRTFFRLLLTPGLSGLEQLERRLLEVRQGVRGRWVLHPLAVRALTGFVIGTFLTEAPHTRWSSDPDDDAPLWIARPGGATIRSDPEHRVVQFIIRGRKAALTDYVQSVLEQSAAH